MGKGETHTSYIGRFLAAAFLCLLLLLAGAGFSCLEGTLLATEEESLPTETPAEGTPGESTPDLSTPGEETPSEGTPDLGTPDLGTPDFGTPDFGTPDPNATEIPGTPELETPTPSPTPKKTKKPTPSPTLNNLNPPALAKTPLQPPTPTLAPGETLRPTTLASMKPTPQNDELATEQSGWSWARVVRLLSWIFFGLAGLAIVYMVYFILWTLILKKEQSLWKTLRKKNSKNTPKG